MAEENPEDTAKQNVQYRLANEYLPGLYFIAGFSDLITIFPFANDVWVFIGQFILAVALGTRGVSVIGRKNWVWYAVGWIIELIPGLSIFPTFLLELSRWIVISRTEDLESEKAKTITRMALKNKTVQQIMRKAEKFEVNQAAKNPDGSFNRDKIREKRSEIAERRAGLDKALAPDTNSGIRGLVNRQPNFKQKPANDNEPEQVQEAA